MNRIPKNPDFPENTCRNLAISGQIQKNDRTSQGMAEERKIELIPESQIDGELDKKLRAFLSEIFPEWSEIFQIHRAWHEAVPVFSAVAFDSNRQIIGHVGVVERTISTCWNWRYTVASFQGVSVHPNCRKTGLGKQLLKMALHQSTVQGYPFAILFCREPLVPFYQANGWLLPEDSMIMWRDRELPVHMRSNCPMYRQLAGQKWPEGPIDVHNPFDPIHSPPAGHP